MTGVLNINAYQSTVCSEIKLQLGNAIHRLAMLSGIAVNQTIHPHLDAGATRTILEGVYPVSIDLGG